MLGPQQNWAEKQNERIRQRFEASEWVLNILRSQGAAPLPKLSDSDIFLWNKRLSTLPRR